MNLDAMGQQPNIDVAFGGQRLHHGTAPTKFQIGQSFQNKEEVVLTIEYEGL